ncbi:hypothetical protein [Curtobacterium sp. ISL-83]|uniref:hypothetical protein n=1 Tax=Curtobacterium sp. ISL-83 TaxID=2819145 RepID=UPI001BEA4757|nr:hypothetical protein [Curtobacterium sp. ISL-83]MBT2502836.1 hypothetical protein [Curtobacterium sp. ISL-83]
MDGTAPGTTPEPEEPQAAHPGPESLPSAADSIDALPDRSSAFFNALLTEHFVLESARGITVSESSTRASLYLTTLSSSLVAFGFLANSPAAGPFLGIVIPVVCVLGLFTYERLVQTSLEDVAALDAMQRIRRYYGKLLPGADAFFPRPRGRHALNELLDIGVGGSRRNAFFTISTAIGVVNSMVAGAGAAVVVYRFAGTGGAVAVGVAVAVAAVIGHLAFQVRQYERLVRLLTAQHDR